LPDDFTPSQRIGNFIMRGTGQRIAGDVTNAIAGCLDGVHIKRRLAEQAQFCRQSWRIADNQRWHNMQINKNRKLLHHKQGFPVAELCQCLNCTSTLIAPVPELRLLHENNRSCWRPIRRRPSSSGLIIVGARQIAVPRTQQKRI